jgi:hypothetical protein
MPIPHFAHFPGALEVRWQWSHAYVIADFAIAFPHLAHDPIFVDDMWHSAQTNLTFAWIPTISALHPRQLPDFIEATWHFSQENTFDDAFIGEALWPPDWPKADDEAPTSATRQQKVMNSSFIADSPGDVIRPERISS